MKDGEKNNQINNTTVIIPSYKTADIFTSPHNCSEIIRESEESEKEIVQLSQTEILIKDEGEEISNDEAMTSRKTLRIEDFELLRVFNSQSNK
jgi:hypothetical protein